MVSFIAFSLSHTHKLKRTELLNMQKILEILQENLDSLQQRNLSTLHKVCYRFLDTGYKNSIFISYEVTN